MARRSRRSRTSNSSNFPSAISPTRSLSHRLLADLTSLEPLRLIEDRRTYHPLEFFRPARTTSGHPAQPLKVTPTPKNKSRPFVARGLSFSLPQKVVICVRRKQRKEVLHAFNKTGRGSGRTRRRKNWFSKVGC